MGNSKFIRLSAFFLAGLCYFLWIRPFGLNDQENSAYNIILCLYGIMVIYGFAIFYQRRVFVFEPIIVIYAMYMGIFVYQPIVDIAQRSYTLVGVNPLPGCLKASMIVAASFGLLMIGYYRPHKKKNYYRLTSYGINRDTSLKTDPKVILKMSYLIWGISWLVYSMSWVSARGASLSYLLTLGMEGQVNDAMRAQTPLGFLFNFGSCMIASYAYIFIHEQKRWLKVSAFVLSILAYMFAGYRFIIIQFVSTLIIYNYAKKIKNPKSAIVGGLAFASLLFASVVEFIRGGLRTGSGVQVQGYNFVEHIFSPFESNFTLYKVFYRFVDVFPDQYPYTWGNTMIWETIYFVIPRAIWPGKPRTELFQRMAEAFGPEILQTGTALNNIAEYYYEFGPIGCMVFMYLFGYIFGRGRMIYLKRDANDHDLILFSMLFSLAFSCVNAGYMPMNFYMILLTIAPVLYMKRYK